jgi:hypothetical protein
LDKLNLELGNQGKEDSFGCSFFDNPEFSIIEM